MKSYSLASSILDPTGGSATGQEYFGAPSAEPQNGDTTSHEDGLAVRRDGDEGKFPSAPSGTIKGPLTSP